MTALAPQCDVCEALRNMDGQLHRFIRDQVFAHRDVSGSSVTSDQTAIGWGISGIGNLAYIDRESGLPTD